MVSVWDFGAVHPQSERIHYVCNEHPAKMRPSLAKAILQLYGESPVLDPMAGIGTTLVEAILLGMDAVGIEYEQKFVDQANTNIEHVRETFPNVKLGRAVCVQGDARRLTLERKKIKCILFSPPYWKVMKSQTSSKQEAIKKYQSSVERTRKVGGRPISKALAISSMGYSRSKENIGNMTKFGSIVFSPPYFDALSMNKGGGSMASILHEETTRDLQVRRSGPFAAKKNLPTPYSSKEGNIGNLPEFGSIILGSSYGAAMNAPTYVGRIASRAPRLAKKSGVNAENMDDRTYIGEMLKVYSECYRVLKPGKFMIVVVKDIQRNWKTVPLGADTIKLCQLAGFECHDVIINKMYFPSFWVLSLAKKSQEAEGTRRFHTLKSHEYVLVFRKPFNR